MRLHAIGWLRGLGLRGKVAAGACALAVLTAAGAAASSSEPSAGVLKVRVGGDAHQTRIVIELDHAASGKLLSGADPARAVTLALPHVELSGDMAGAGAGLVKSWTMDHAAGAARLKLELVRDVQVKRRFLLPPGDGYPAYRYVMDVSADLDRPAPARVTAAASKPDRIAAVERRIEPLQPLTPARKVIVIDAGHGGKDPGAAGQDSREKALTLAAARALRDRLEGGGRYKVVLTRDTDVFIPLERRVEIARRANADLFISLHADSGSDASVRGATVYTLSQKGADRVARHVIGNGTGADNWFMRVNLPGGDAQVNRILLDLSQRDARNRSATFAEMVLDRISDRTTLLRRSHRDAGFMVLLAPDVPAVLMEMGFVTNREDERAMMDPDRRRRVMEAVGDSIDAYFAQEQKLAAR